MSCQFVPFIQEAAESLGGFLFFFDVAAAFAFLRTHCTHRRVRAFKLGMYRSALVVNITRLGE